ncbi:hypothetical protein GFY24_33365 [Nocardia sp. SYP-A9097]|uniref:hypothetical protein n=1 Tax=Nocardia sp. SYP-A9097 TaxID=2663237 RepID=UPI00129A942E|nr:hypothetical protein [Nocardia sp. SYP-A9097]MRH92268.1 hypothetical protein [Nocardia sp. SYP-A9097]
MIGVAVGGWVTLQAQRRLLRRDDHTQWRDIRLAAYTSYLNAFREYVAYVQRPGAHMSVVPRPLPPHDPMPIFDESGSGYKERLEATKTVLRLVSGQPRVVRASNLMVRCARQMAADRAVHAVEALPSERFEQLWSAEREFVLAARGELGLPNDFEIGDRQPRGTDGEGDEFELSPLAVWIQYPE